MSDGYEFERLHGKKEKEIYICPFQRGIDVGPPSFANRVHTCIGVSEKKSEKMEQLILSDRYGFICCFIDENFVSTTVIPRVPYVNLVSDMMVNIAKYSPLEVVKYIFGKLSTRIASIIEEREQNEEGREE